MTDPSVNAPFPAECGRRTDIFFENFMKEILVVPAAAVRDLFDRQGRFQKKPLRTAQFAENDELFRRNRKTFPE